MIGDLATWWSGIESGLAGFFGNIKLVEKAMMGFEGSYVELLTILALGLLAVLPAVAPPRHRQRWRHLNQLFGVVIFIFVVFTCLGVFGMIRNFHRGLSEIGRENIVALYYCSVPATILVTSLLFGPAFCGWICPTGALQEFTGLLTNTWNRRRKAAGYPFSKGALAMALIIVAIFIGWMIRLSLTRLFFVEDASIYWSEVLVLLVLLLTWNMRRWDAPLRRLRLLSFWIVVGASVMSLRVTSPVHLGFAKVYDPASFLSTVMVILATLVIPRVWCRYLCPWRAAIGWAAARSARHIVLDEKACTKCGECDGECEVDAVEKGVITADECHFCLKCVDRCPQKALSVKDDWRRPCHK
jgi:polyferredoxin